MTIRLEDLVEIDAYDTEWISSLVDRWHHFQFKLL